MPAISFARSATHCVRFGSQRQIEHAISPESNVSLSIDEDGIAVITLGGDGKGEWGTKAEEHRMTNMFLGTIHKMLDELETNEKAKAVIFHGEGKFFS